jgi:hypothetical protein
MKPPRAQCAHHDTRTGQRCIFRVWKPGALLCIDHDILSTLTPLYRGHGKPCKPRKRVTQAGNRLTITQPKQET